MNKFSESSSIFTTASKYLVSLRRLISASSWLLTRYFLILVLDCLRFQTVLNMQAVSQTTESSASSPTFNSSLSASSGCRPGWRLLRNSSSLIPTPSLAWQWMRAWLRFSSVSCWQPWALHLELAFGFVRSTLSLVGSIWGSKEIRKEVLGLRNFFQGEAENLFVCMQMASRNRVKVWLNKS